MEIKSKHACPILCLYSLSQYKQYEVQNNQLGIVFQYHRECQPETDEIACIIVHTNQNETESNFFFWVLFYIAYSYWLAAKCGQQAGPVDLSFVVLTEIYA